MATRKSTKHQNRPGTRALGYTRVSTEQQADSGAGLDAQRAAITTEADRQGWSLEVLTDAGLSGATMNRPALADALARLDRGEADILLASKLDRVSRSVRDFAELLDRARRHGWRVVLLDLGDTSSASGEMTANIIASAAQYERRLIGIRTREGLAAKRAQGVRLGRRPVLPLETVSRIVRERKHDVGLRVIAEGLTVDRVGTRADIAARIAEGMTVEEAVVAPGRSCWSTSSVQAVLAGQDAQRLQQAQ